jgi:hypothetical protein
MVLDHGLPRRGILKVRVAASRASGDGSELDTYLIDSLPQTGYVIRVKLAERSGESLHVMEADLSGFGETSERVACPRRRRINTSGIGGISNLVARLGAEYTLDGQRSRGGGCR